MCGRPFFCDHCFPHRFLESSLHPPKGLTP
jgi:hypothetical protein